MASGRSGITGKWYNYHPQGKANSCAPSCVRMMGELINGSDPGEGTTRAFVAVSEGGTSTLGDGGVVSHTGHDFETTPTEPDPMVAGLKALRPAIEAEYIFADPTSAELRAKIAEVSPQNPMIIGVFWAGGGGHVVVGVDKHADSNRIIVADPAYGVKFIEPDGSYAPETGVTGRTVLAVYKT